MNRLWKHRTLIASAVCAVALTASGVQAEVYRWTDQHGQVHYGAHPPADDAQRIELQVQPPVSGAAAVDRERRERQRRLLESYAYEREQKRAAAQEAAHARELRRQDCARLQRHWRALSAEAPVFLKHKDGRREYLSDAQRATRKQRLRARYRETCGGEPQ